MYSEATVTTLPTDTKTKDWRNGNVVPIHKMSDKTEPSNYRPIKSDFYYMEGQIIKTKLEDHIHGKVNRDLEKVGLT